MTCEQRYMASNRASTKPQQHKSDLDFAVTKRLMKQKHEKTQFASTNSKKEQFLRFSRCRSHRLDHKMSKSESNRIPGKPENTQAEIRGFVRRVQDDLYFGPDNVRVVLARMDERLRNTATRMDERLSNTATREDIANLKISMIRWFLGSSLTLAGIIVTAFKWLLP